MLNRLNLGKYGLKQLARYGYSQPSVSQFATHKESYEYDKHKIVIGRNVFDREPVKLKTTKTFRIFNYGPSGCGKTVCTERITSEFLSNNRKHRAAILTDVKPEFYSMSEPLQEKYAKRLGRDDPTGFPCVSYYPAFLNERNKLHSSRHTISQLDASRLSISDILNFLKDELSAIQQAELE